MGEKKNQKTGSHLNMEYYIRIIVFVVENGKILRGNKFFIYFLKIIFLNLTKIVI